MSKRWWMVAGALLLLGAAPSVVQAAAESVVTVTLGRQSPTGSFGDVAQSGTMAAVSGGFRVAPWLAVGADFTYFKAPGGHDGQDGVGRGAWGAARAKTATKAAVGVLLGAQIVEGRCQVGGSQDGQGAA